MPIIDPPGDGNCGYYAVAIGLIDIVKKELEENNGKSNTLDEFNKKVGEKYSPDFFKNFDLGRVNAENLKDLQIKLRALNEQAYLEDFRLNGGGSALALQRAQSFDNFNLFKNNNETNEVAVARLKGNRRWATATDLQVLCTYLGLDVAIEGIIKAENNGKPTIVLVHQANNHWQTEVENAPVLSKNNYVANKTGASQDKSIHPELKALLSQFRGGKYAAEKSDGDAIDRDLAEKFQNEEFENAGYKRGL